MADTFDAITSVRPYRAPRKQQAALRILKQESGTRLDPQAVTAFLSCYAGRRTAAWSSFAVAVPERLVGIFMGGGSGPLAQGAAATIALAGIGGAFVNPALQSDAPPAKVAASPDRGPVEPRHGHTAAARPAEDRPGAGRDDRSRTPKGSEDTDRQRPAPAPGGAPEESAPIVNDTPSGTNQPSTGSQPAGGGGSEGGNVERVRGLPQALLDLLPGNGGGAPTLPPAPRLPEVPRIPDLPAAPGV